MGGGGAATAHVNHARNPSYFGSKPQAGSLKGIGRAIGSDAGKLGEGQGYGADNSTETEAGLMLSVFCPCTAPKQAKTDHHSPSVRKGSASN
jgi:hypothetical protein